MPPATFKNTHINKLQATQLKKKAPFKGFLQYFIFLATN